MKHDLSLQDFSPPDSSKQKTRVSNKWLGAWLRALHASRRRQAVKIIRDNGHLLAAPEQISTFMKTCKEQSMPADKPAPATETSVPVMVTRGVVITVVVLAVFLLHLIVAATLLDSGASNAGHTPTVSHTD